MNILITGPAGSGKSVLAARLADQYSETFEQEGRLVHEGVRGYFEGRYARVVEDASPQTYADLSDIITDNLVSETLLILTSQNRPEQFDPAVLFVGKYPRVFDLVIDLDGLKITA